MTDAVWVALISSAAPVLSATISLLVLVLQFVNNRKVTKSTEKIEKKVEREAASIKAAAAGSEEKWDLMRTDAHWSGVMERDKHEFKLATDFGKLQRSATEENL